MVEKHLLCGEGLNRTFAVMPGLSNSSLLSIRTTASYVTTFWTTVGALRTWVHSTPETARRKSIDSKGHFLALGHIANVGFIDIVCNLHFGEVVSNDETRSAPEVRRQTVWPTSTLREMTMPSTGE